MAPLVFLPTYRQRREAADYNIDWRTKFPRRHGTRRRHISRAAITPRFQRHHAERHVSPCRASLQPRRATVLKTERFRRRHHDLVMIAHDDNYLIRKTEYRR